MLLNNDIGIICYCFAAKFRGSWILVNHNFTADVSWKNKFCMPFTKFPETQWKTTLFQNCHAGLRSSVVLVPASRPRPKPQQKNATTYHVYDLPRARVLLHPCVRGYYPTPQRKGLLNPRAKGLLNPQRWEKEGQAKGLVNPQKTFTKIQPKYNFYTFFQYFCKTRGV